MFLLSRLTQQEFSNPPAEPGITAHYCSSSFRVSGLGVSGNPEEITTETDRYTVNWDLAKGDRGTDI